MDDALFSELLESVQEALDHSQGKRDLKTTILPPPPEPMGAEDVRALRWTLRRRCSRATSTSARSWFKPGRRSAGRRMVLPCG